MTSFLNLCIANKIMSLKVQKYKNTGMRSIANQIKFAQKDLKKW